MKKRNNKGFSLIELIIAIAILVILTGLLAPQFMRYMEKSREAKDMQTLDTVYSAVQTALADEKAYDVVKADIASSPSTDLINKGITLSALLAIDNAFVTEIKASLGTVALDKAWTSKAVTEAGGNTATFIMINKDTLQVSVWIGSVGADGKVPDASVLGTVPKSTTGTVFRIIK